MFSLQALERVRRRCDPASDMAPNLRAEADSLGQAWRQASVAEDVLRRLARHRTGHDDVGAAFAANELGRLRPLLVAAGQAHGRVTRSFRTAS